MSKYINFFIRFLFFILALPIIFYLCALRYVNMYAYNWESKVEDIISSIERFLDKFFPAMSK